MEGVRFLLHRSPRIIVSNPFQGTRDSETTAIPPDPRQRLELLHDCRELVVSRLSKLVSEALAKMSEELAALASDSIDSEEQQALMDAISVVRQHRTEIELRFRRAFTEVFERRMSGAPDPQHEVATAFSELSLVDDSVIQARLTLDRLARRARGSLDPEEVLGMRARLAALLDRDWFEEDRHPAAPEAVFEALKSALAELAPRAEVQSALLDAFEPHVTANLNTVYGTVNERLKADNVLPRLRPQLAARDGRLAREFATQPSDGQPGVGPDSPSRGEGAAGWGGAHSGPGGAPQAFRQGHGGGYPGHGGAGHGGYGGGPQGGYGAGRTGGYGAGPGAYGGHGGGAPSFGQRGPGQGYGYPSRDYGESPGDTFVGDGRPGFDTVLTDLAHGAPTARAAATRMLADPETFAVADLPIPAVEAPLLDALSGLQARSAHARPAPAELLTDLTEHARASGSPLDQLTVEIVSMVFDYIYADKQLADVIKQQLLRLQVVAVKAALIDRSFFARRTHPMRRLIDRISEIASDADADLEPASPLVQGIEEVVEWVLLQFERDLEVFENALERIEVLASDESARRAERIATVTRDAERAESVVHARGLAMARLADRLDPGSPEFVREFLTDWWSLVMGEAQVGGPGSLIESDEAMSVGEGLIWSVQPKQPDEVPRLAALLPRLINGLIRGARLVQMPEDRREAFFDQLLRAHTQAIGAAKQTSSSGRRPGNLRMRADGKIQFVPADVPIDTVQIDPPIVEASSIRLSELRRGDTIEADIAGDGEFRSFRLAWVSPAQRVFVLSRFPEGAVSMDRARIAELFDSGRARLVEKGSALDKAIESIAAASEVVEDEASELPVDG